MGSAASAIRTLGRLFPVVTLAVCLTPIFGVAPITPTGGLKGVVADLNGNPRMGAVVLLFDRQDRLLQRVITNEQGGFAFADLMPQLYSVRVTLSSFLPAIKNNIQVHAGKLHMLDVNLSTLFSSIQLLPLTNGDTRSLMSDDWKWVLRTSTATRPILRILPVQVSPAQISHRAVFSGTRGLVKVSTGDAEDESSDAGDLGTAFALATSLYGANHFKFSGNLGYAADSGVPSAGFRTSFSRELGSDFGGIAPEVSVTMRQMSLPARMGALIPGPSNLDNSSLPPLRMISVNFGDKNRISDSLDIVYGVELDAVSFIERLHYLSPYARITWTGLGGQIDLSYTSGNSRPGLGAEEHGSDPEFSRDLESLNTLPRVSLRESRVKVQRGDDYEVAYSTHRGSRDYRVSLYQQRVSNTALRVSGASGEFAGSLLPDLYSGSMISNAGTFSSRGYSASITQSLGDHCKVSALYSSSAVLTPDSTMIAPDIADDLRHLLRTTRAGAVTLRASAVVPVTGTRVSGSYQWTDYRTIDPAQIYSTQPVHPTPGLNLTVRQPIPATLGLPWRMEATADLRNIRAQGYLPLTAADGRQLLVVQTPRSFRGGLSFIF